MDAASYDPSTKPSSATTSRDITLSARAPWAITKERVQDKLDDTACNLAKCENALTYSERSNKLSEWPAELQFYDHRNNDSFSINIYNLQESLGPLKFDDGEGGQRILTWTAKNASQADAEKINEVLQLPHEYRLRANVRGFDEKNLVSATRVQPSPAPVPEGYAAHHDAVGKLAHTPLVRKFKNLPPGQADKSITSASYKNLCAIIDIANKEPNDPRIETPDEGDQKGITATKELVCWTTVDAINNFTTASAEYAIACEAASSAMSQPSTASTTPAKKGPPPPSGYTMEALTQLLSNNETLANKMGVVFPTAGRINLNLLSEGLRHHVYMMLQADTSLYNQVLQIAASSTEKAGASAEQSWTTKSQSKCVQAHGTRASTTLTSLERALNFALTGCILLTSVLSSHLAYPLTPEVFSEPMKAITASNIGPDGDTTTPEVHKNVSEQLTLARQLLPSLQPGATPAARAKTFDKFTKALLGTLDEAGALNIDRIACTHELQGVMEQLATKLSSTIQSGFQSSATGDESGDPPPTYLETDFDELCTALQNDAFNVEVHRRQHQARGEQATATITASMKDLLASDGLTDDKDDTTSDDNDDTTDSTEFKAFLAKATASATEEWYGNGGGGGGGGGKGTRRKGDGKGHGKGSGKGRRNGTGSREDYRGQTPCANGLFGGHCNLCTMGTCPRRNDPNPEAYDPKIVASTLNRFYKNLAITLSLPMLQKWKADLTLLGPVTLAHNPEIQAHLNKAAAQPVSYKDHRDRYLRHHASTAPTFALLENGTHKELAKEMVDTWCAHPGNANKL
jgi:hypothetical protein